MLVLTRRVGEVLIIGDNIKITLLDIKSNQVKIGIDAPTEINVVREEVAHRKPRGDYHGRKAEAKRC